MTQFENNILCCVSCVFHSLVFEHYYLGPTLTTTNSSLVLQQISEILQTANNQTGDAIPPTEGHLSVLLPESLVLCTRERPILCLLLMLGTLWLGYALYLFKRGYSVSFCFF